MGDDSTTCRICGRPELDQPWEALAGDDPGPRTLAIGRARHSSTGLDLMGQAMRDDDGALRCVTCLALITEDRVLYWLDEGRTVARVYHLPGGAWLTGQELLCCGSQEGQTCDTLRS